MNPIRSGLGLSGGTLVVVAVIFYAAFTVGGSLGAQEAANGTQSLDGIHNNLTEVQHETQRDIDQNLTTPVKQLAGAPLSIVFKGTLTSVHWGLDFGYAFPTVARANAGFAPIFVFVLSLGMTLRTLRRSGLEPRRWGWP